MKPLHHHVQRLANRMMQAENASSRDEAREILKKVEKHQEKISLIKRLLDPLEKVFKKS